MLIDELSMKKVLSLVTMLAALAGSASAAPYVLPSPQPGALTAYDIQPVYAVDALYAMSDDAPDSWGVRGSLSLYSDAESSFRHQFSLNVAYLTGDETSHGVKADMDLIPVTLGYDMNIEITDNVMFTMGGKAGYAFGEGELKDADGKIKADLDGFTFSVGAGIKVQCSESVYLRAGYEYAKTSPNESDVDDIKQHIISVGVGCQF